MTRVHDMTVASFDLETTGVDPFNDRIVTAAIVVEEPGCPAHVSEWLIDPGVDIPQGATDVHGITTDHARSQGQPAAGAVAEITAALFGVWSQGIPVVVYNAPFDLTMLAAENARHGGAFEVRGPVIDPLVIDKAVDTYRRGKRTLTAVCEAYGVEFRGEAHGATADAQAALGLARRLLGDFDDVDLRQLYVDQQGWYRQQRESFAAYLARNGRSLDDDSMEWPIRTGRAA